jgi:hypothetical protein
MTIVYRGTKGSSLTYAEMDENFRDLYQDTTLHRILSNGNVSNNSLTVGNLVANTLSLPTISFTGSTQFIANTNPTYIPYSVNVNGTVNATAANFGSLTTDTFTYNSMAGATHTTSVTGSVTPDFNLYTNFIWSLTGNITLNNPSTEIAGQSGIFVFYHSGGARTVSLDTDYEAPNGSLLLSSVAGYTDIVPYFVAATGRIIFGQSTKNIV